MHYITLIFSALFFIAMGYSLLENDIDNAVVQIITGTVLLVFSIILKRDIKFKNELSDWIKRNHEQIINDGADYHGIIIDQETEFMQYEVCVSIGLFSYRRKTGYYIKDYHYTQILNFLFTSFTLIFGWWAIPSGPINTIRVFTNNIFTKPKRIDEVINNIVTSEE